MTDIKYSQNYMKNRDVIRYLVERAGIGKSDYVIEIGPGKGMITDVLSEYAGKVTAVEYDKKLFEQLKVGCHRENVEYIHENFLRYSLPERGSYKVFSNIPFQITADILHKLAECPNLPTEIFLVV